MYLKKPFRKLSATKYANEFSNTLLTSVAELYLSFAQTHTLIETSSLIYHVLQFYDIILYYYTNIFHIFLKILYIKNG